MCSVILLSVKNKEGSVSIRELTARNFEDVISRYNFVSMPFHYVNSMVYMYQCIIDFFMHDLLFLT